MLIPIKKIKPSPKPIRSKWDEGAMEELKKSIAEQGLIVPIKVRPLDGEYEIVYGHRRVEAIRRLGWKECEAIVEGMELDDAHVQAFIENVQREDLGPLDKARAVKAIQESAGWSLAEMERRGIIAVSTASELLAILEQPKEVVDILSAPKGQARGYRSILEVARSGLDEETKVEVAKKIDREDLTREQARAVARAVKATRDESTRKAILETPIVKTPTPRQLVEEAEVEGIVERVAAREEEEKERAWWREHPSTKEFLDLLRMYLRLIRRAWDSVLKEKIPPEHCNYLAGFIEDKVIGLLQEIVAGLRDKAKKWQ